MKNVASILPVAIHNAKLYFLFGKENELEDTAEGFSDFGGAMDEGETPFQTALREGSEELTGFLGTSEMLKQRIKKTGMYKIHHTFTDFGNTYTVFIFPILYDTSFVEYFNNNHAFLWEKMDKHMLNDSKLFEKIKIDWFCEDDLEKRMPEYRSFYREIVQCIIEEKSKIRKFITRKRKQTQKYHNHIVRKMSLSHNTTRNFHGGK